jgi:hypothetical protein
MRKMSDAVDKVIEEFRTNKRLDDLEKRWQEVNSRQGRMITRLMVMRQRVLDLMDEDGHIISETARQEIREALNLEVPDELLKAIIKQMREAKE